MTFFRFNYTGNRYSFTNVGIIEVNFKDRGPYWGQDGFPVPISFDEVKKLVKLPKLKEESIHEAFNSVWKQNIDIGCQRGFIVNGLLIIVFYESPDRCLIIYNQIPDLHFHSKARMVFQMYDDAKEFNLKSKNDYKLFLRRAKKIPWLRARLSKYLKPKSNKKERR